MRTETHKLIYFWKKDQWELFDLVNDPDELHNLYNDPRQQGLVAKLKAELYRLKRGLKDFDQFADGATAQRRSTANRPAGRGGRRSPGDEGTRPERGARARG